MNDVFKQNLLRCLPTTFAQALMGETHWGSQKRPIPQDLAKVEAFSEKKQVLESLERFALEKIQEGPGDVLTLPGGEIALKAPPLWNDIPRFENFEELKNHLSCEPQTLEICLRPKFPEKVRIMFVPEIYRSFEEYSSDLREGPINQFLATFPSKTAELFSRMIQAMKLEDHEVLIYPSLMGDKDISHETMSVAGFYRPEIIVTLGANPTHKILKGQERLAQVHGQFFQRKIENIGQFIIVPLFHPSIIENNQNMKKTAWSDMQKIMRQLKKL